MKLEEEGKPSQPSGLELTRTMGDADLRKEDGLKIGRKIQENEEDYEEDIDEDVEEGAKRWMINDQSVRPHKISAKKRADKAAFEVFLEEHRDQLSEESNHGVTDKNQMTAAWLVKDFGAKRIITSPRDYQMELYERAKQENIIVVLDTGSGKTLIAALLLRWTLEKELEDRAMGQPKRVAFFLVDKVVLVYQQHAVLKSNLDYPIEKLCGETAVWEKARWRKMLDENMVIVCTAEILNKSLHHSFFKMAEVNLLVFDEAHNAKKNHPYARIVKDYYAEIEDNERRPRILGMTASPVDSQESPERAAAELEGLLHSRIAMAADPRSLQRTICKPKSEIVVEYMRSFGPKAGTSLHRQLENLLFWGRNGEHYQFRADVIFAREAATQLGPWVADRFWQLRFRQENLLVFEAQTERDVSWQGDSLILDRFIQDVRDAQELVTNHQFDKPIIESEQFSPKVRELYAILCHRFRDSTTDKRCIVFVNQRQTVKLLVDLLRQPEVAIPGLKVAALVGLRKGDNVLESSLRQQLLTIAKFGQGEINCIFATSVAEEGLDVPDCNVIIRFDLPNTTIQNIQSRGRARKQDSEYILMAESGNSEHIRLTRQVTANEGRLREFCEALPEDRKLTGNDFDMDYYLRKEKDQTAFRIASTGAKLTYKHSLVCLNTFTASLPHAPTVSLVPEYTITTVAGGFECQVLLPSVSPIRDAVGKVKTTKATAKCSAAFEMCLKLLKGKYLDEHLQPVFTKQLPAMRNARLAVSSKKRAEYPKRIKPESLLAVGEPEKLYATALTLSQPEALGRDSTPLVLFTRMPLPTIPTFPLFFSRAISSEVYCIPIPGVLTLSDGDYTQALAKFTFQIFRDIFSKEYEATAADLPYFLAPSLKGHGDDFSKEELVNIVDWKTLDFVKNTDEIKCDLEATDEFFKDKFIADPFDGAVKFFMRQRRHDLKPTDSVPEGIIPPRHRGWRTCKDKNILNYSNSLWSKARSKWIMKEDQPVVEAELLTIRRNLLDDNIQDEDVRPKQCFLVLETLRISPLPVTVVAMAYNFPAIVHRIESTLIAQDACRILGLKIRPDLALEALTKDSDNTEEHDAEKINFQAGMGNNYERLEFLGDSFLKMATTISIYTLVPDKDEFEYHCQRMVLICNKNLLNNALEINLQEYVRSMSFDRRSWYPEGLKLVKGRKNSPSKTHVLADKSIADVCEALIGAAYLTSQEDNNFDMAIRAVSAMVKDKMHNMTTWSQYYEHYSKPEWQTAPASAIDRETAEKHGPRLGHTFKYPRLLRCALMHPSSNSRLYYKLPTYQCLEFLGDALFDMVAVDYLFHKFPGADPQWLTEHKMAMVSNQFLGCLAVSLGLNQAINVTSVPVRANISNYVRTIEDALQAAKDAAVAAGKPGSAFARDFWVEQPSPPKCLPDVVEAYIGAIFVDSEYNYDKVRDFFHRFVLPYFEDMRIYDTYANKHPVTFLSNLMGTRFHCTDWRIITNEMDDDDAQDTLLGGKKVVCGFMVHGKTAAVAQAESGRYAKMAVARKAMKMLQEVEMEKFREDFKCDCMPEVGSDQNSNVGGQEKGTGVA